MGPGGSGSATFGVVDSSVPVTAALALEFSACGGSRGHGRDDLARREEAVKPAHDVLLLQVLKAPTTDPCANKVSISSALSAKGPRFMIMGRTSLRFALAIGMPTSTDFATCSLSLFLWAHFSAAMTLCLFPLIGTKSSPPSPAQFIRKRSW